MDNKYETQKVPMMGTVYTVIPPPLPLTENVEVQKTRKTLIIILGVLLVSIFLCYFWMVIRTIHTMVYFILI